MKLIKTAIISFGGALLIHEIATTFKSSDYIRLVVGLVLCFLFVFLFFGFMVWAAERGK